MQQQEKQFWFYNLPIWIRIFFIIIFPPLFLLILLWPIIPKKLIFIFIIAWFAFWVMVSLFGLDNLTNSDISEGKIDVQFAPIEISE